ncbi:MAG: outer membrane beta-barrel protein [Candidatus Kapabacteria bacterium]|nr:outer membrane beta-barrel protein [Ignavibacteriota bacterium]MCW5885606.1 outer membrane beta-barrel protein [Candidatus Kapabacteria bacterium]
MKKVILLIVLILTISAANNSLAQIYGGLGVGYVQPFSDFEEINKPAMSYIVNLENRYYCKLWYGVKFEYSEFDPQDGLNPDAAVYTNMLNITPQVRYNFLGLNCYDNVAFPYLQLGLTLSSAGNTDNTSRFGLGALGGGGVSYGFNLFRTCFLIDLNASYNMPNIILKDEERIDIQYLHLNLILNVKL